MRLFFVSSYKEKSPKEKSRPAVKGRKRDFSRPDPYAGSRLKSLFQIKTDLHVPCLTAGVENVNGSVVAQKHDASRYRDCHGWH